MITVTWEVNCDTPWCSAHKHQYNYYSLKSVVDALKKEGWEHKEDTDTWKCPTCVKHKAS